MRIENTNNATDKQNWVFPWHAKQDNKATTKKKKKKDFKQNVSKGNYIRYLSAVMLYMIYKNNWHSFYHGNNIDT